MKKQKVAIIGFGRFGKLLAEILMPYAEVFVIARRDINDDRFKQIDFKDLKNCDWVIPVVPISATLDILKKIRPFLKKGTVVMDVCSVKVNPCKWLEEILSKDVQVLGSHPMFGPDSARQGLKGLEMVFCPVRISSEKFKMIKEIFAKMDLEIIETTPENHDEESAISLALVHFIGRGLKDIDIRDQKISTMGFRRLLQLKDNVTNDTKELFNDMHKFNPYAKDARKKYLDSLQKINSELD